jgi:ABC-type sugar transport system substrate-binding protein
MVMFSAHVEYGAQFKYTEYFHDYVSIAANWDPNKQIEDIRSLLAQGIDLLLIDPLDTTVVAQGVEEAMGQGVPVILASSRVANAPYVSWVATDAEERGTACAFWMSQSIPGGRVAILQSQFAAGDQGLWLQGVGSQLHTHPDLEPIVARCPWSSAGAKQTMASLLQQHTSIEGVIVNNGVLARGAVEAFAEQGRDIPPIAGADDWNGWLRTAKQHGVRFWALSGGANLGLYCVGLATEVLSGQETPTYVPFPFEAFGAEGLELYFRPELSDHYWAVHDLPEAWIERMYRT